MDLADWAYIRLEVETAMPDTITIQTRTRYQDGQGGLIDSYINSYQDVKARLAQNSGRETSAAGREYEDAAYTLTVPYDQNITEQMRVVHEGQSYEVIGVNTGASYATARRCQLKRL